MFHIVLMQPEIPQNTGNVLRTCAATRCELHIVKPLGFELDDRRLKRAGLDYWHLARMHVHEDLDALLSQFPNANKYLFSTHGTRLYTEASFAPGSLLFFGRETAGLGSEMLMQYPDCVYRLPMAQEARSLNLSNSAAVVLYEALRQTEFDGLV